MINKSLIDFYKSKKKYKNKTFLYLINFFNKYLFNKSKMKILESKIIFIFLISLMKIFKSIYIEEKHHSKIKNNFVFGSCFIGRISDKFDIFNTIGLNNPELYVWLGDAAYADNKIPINGEYFNYEFSKDLFNQSKTNEGKN